MKVHDGITVSFFDVIGNVTKEWDTFVLDEPAKGGISGSRIDLEKDDFRVGTSLSYIQYNACASLMLC